MDIKVHVFYLKPIQYIGGIVLGMKPLISPTKYKYQAAKIFVIFNFNHNLEG
jgi:hypothetical protein